MMIRSTFFMAALSGLLVTGSAFAATVTVGPTGDFATINDALESLNYQDGVPDLVLVQPGIYDEQVKLKGNAGVSSSAWPAAPATTYAAIEACVQSHPDPLTLRSADPDNPAVLTSTAANPPDFVSFNPLSLSTSQSTLPPMSRNTTVEGIELRQGDAGQYAMNGMASDYTLRDMHFTIGAPIPSLAQGFADWNNHHGLLSSQRPTIGLDQTTVWDSNLFDLESQADGLVSSRDFLWFHGFNDITAGFPDVAESYWTNNVARNIGGVLHQHRANNHPTGTGFRSQTMEDNFYYNMVGNKNFYDFPGPQGSGGGPLLNRNVFMSGPRHSGTFIRTENRSGVAGPAQLTIVNNLFVGGGSEGLANTGNLGDNIVTVGTRPAVQLDANAATGGWNASVVNNTFFNYSTAIQANGVNTNCTVLIANNIFYATDTGTFGTAITGNFDNVQGTLVNNGFFNNDTNIGGTGTPTESGSVFSDPAFAADASDGIAAVGGPTDVNIRTAPLRGDDFQNRVGRQNFIPTGNDYVDGGDNASYNSAWGDVDVDSLNARVGGGTIDIGAQESNGASVVASWDMY